MIIQLLQICDILIYPPALIIYIHHLLTVLHWFIQSMNPSEYTWNHEGHMWTEITWHVNFYVMLERSRQMQFLGCHHDCLSYQYHTDHTDAESCYFRQTLYLVVSGKHWAYSAARRQAVCFSSFCGLFAAVLLYYNSLNQMWLSSKTAYSLFVWFRHWCL